MFFYLCFICGHLWLNKINCSAAGAKSFVVRFAGCVAETMQFANKKPEASFPASGF